MNDLISRQAAIDAAMEELDGGTPYDIPNKIMALPSAQPERKKGKWIDEGDPLTLRCSKCDYRVARYNNTNYCPHCGAEMEGSDD